MNLAGVSARGSLEAADVSLSPGFALAHPYHRVVAFTYEPEKMVLGHERALMRAASACLGRSRTAEGRQGLSFAAGEGRQDPLPCHGEAA